jgi:hypothetical protein
MPGRVPHGTLTGRGCSQFSVLCHDWRPPGPQPDSDMTRHVSRARYLKDLTNRIQEISSFCRGQFPLLSHFRVCAFTCHGSVPTAQRLKALSLITGHCPRVSRYTCCIHVPYLQPVPIALARGRQAIRVVRRHFIQVTKARCLKNVY